MPEEGGNAIKSRAEKAENEKTVISRGGVRNRPHAATQLSFSSAH